MKMRGYLCEYNICIFTLYVLHSFENTNMYLYFLQFVNTEVAGMSMTRPTHIINITAVDIQASLI